MVNIYSNFDLGDMNLCFIHDDETGIIGLQIIPSSMKDKIPKHREDLCNQPEIQKMKCFANPLKAWNVMPLVQVSLCGDQKSSGYSQGETLLNGSTGLSLKFISQEILKDGNFTKIITVCKNISGLIVQHFIEYIEKDEYFTVHSDIQNSTKEMIKIELLTSFTLGFITPFDADDAPGRLYIHRYRATWSGEGRHECISVEELELFRSWTGHAVKCERFGQIGTKPVRKWFPFAAVEDRVSGCFWGASIEAPGSWQIELLRKDDYLNMSGGLADREFGHWIKNLNSGESFTTPKAFITTAKSDIAEIGRRLTSVQYKNIKEDDSKLPVIFNEWCTSWGKPSEETLLKTAESLKELDIEYLVIDAGWYAPDDNKGNWEDSHGDWIPSKVLFPSGLKSTCEKIRKYGVIPGLWFEFDSCGSNSSLWNRLDLLLTRDNSPIHSGTRRFLDIRKKEVREYLNKKVIGLLKDCGIGFLKVDQNETIGIGADDAESFGEGLRQYVDETLKFFKKIKEEIPGILIENCSSGGQRLEPAFINITDVSSFSDAHELNEIPIVAANVLNHIIPSKSLVWAVLRKNDSDKRLIYSLSATFLGRMCLSGEITDFNDEQKSIVKNAIKLYRSITEIIINGKTTREGTKILNYRYPDGYQVLTRLNNKNDKGFAVVHKYSGDIKDIKIILPKSQYEIINSFKDSDTKISIKDNEITISGLDNFSGCVIVFKTR